jgi:hypothetical protein
MPLIAAIHTNNLSRFISGFVGRKAMLGWAGTLVFVAAVACTSVGDDTSVADVTKSAPATTVSLPVDKASTGLDAGQAIVAS